MVGEGAAMAAAMAALLVQIRRFDRHHHRVLGGANDRRHYNVNLSLIL